VPEGSPVETIEHGHYREWFARYPRRDAVGGRLAYVGLVRRYKGVDALIAAFRDAFRSAEPEPAATLTVSGKPSSDDLVEQLEREARGDDRISFRFAFLSDEELVTTVTEAELIVLPYREMHNSGGALSSLSLDRPVLVPDNEVNRMLAAEVGELWVQRYQPPLAADDLERALVAVRQRDLSARPDLSGRGWDETGRRHLAAYRRAIELSGRRNGRTRRA
jgi:glycosyltransferase involved in cell wall biosynthesis